MNNPSELKKEIPLKEIKYERDKHFYEAGQLAERERCLKMIEECFLSTKKVIGTKVLHEKQLINDVEKIFMEELTQKIKNDGDGK